MKNSFLLLLFLISCTSVFAQLTDDFSDGNFTDNPTWTGNTDRYIVNADGQLQLYHNNPESNNTSYLSTPANTAGMTVWEFFVRTEFSPSTSNFARVYLNSNSADLSGDVNGYYVKIGGISGADDALELWRQDGTTGTMLLSGAVGAVGSDPAQARVRVERDENGNWTLLADYTGGTNFISEGNATDNTYNSGAYFGYWNKYTATRNENFFLDDVFIDPLFVDTEPPQILSVTAENSNTLAILFNEPVFNFSTTNFTINNGITLSAAVADVQNPSLIRLTVSPDFQNFQSYTLTVQNVEDTEGNVLVEAMRSFDFLQAQEVEPGDIILTEIMADPAPTVGLPDAEFVEIHNVSNKVIDVSTLYFVSDDSPDQLSGPLLLPGAYMLLCDDGNENLFTAFGDVATATSFPALTNSGDLVAIEDAEGNVIDRVDYAVTWYDDEEKASGGWTLERIAMDITSNCPANWRASESATGGTPAQENSINGQLPISNPPLLSGVVAIDEFSLLVNFSTEPDADAAGEEANYSIDSGIGILSASVQADNRTVLLVLTDDLASSTVYTLTVSNGVGDCLGNTLADNQSAQFGLAEDMLPGDVVINEILFNPRSGGADYVEFYNKSSKIFNLSTSSGIVPLFPEEHLVLTENRAVVLERFNVKNPNLLIEADLPAFNNDSGLVLLIDNGILIDSFAYSESQHYELLRDENGVALERINPDAPTNEEGNWHSAAATVGYGTPTAVNSQFLEIQEVETSDFFDIPVARVSPDEDGFEDVLVVNYQFDTVGYSANIKIFDNQGRQIKSLINNELLGASGVLKWDGSTDDKSKARLGIYVFWAEIFRPDGTVVEEKKAVVVAGML